MYQKIGSDLLVAEHMQDTFKKIVADDVRTDAKLVAQPTLLIYGQNDEQTPPSWGKLLHECMSNSTFEVLKGADHFLYLSAPKQTLALIKEFIA
jgi:pimeloyl-ACP methyl ester carboxylesterase